MSSSTNNPLINDVVRRRAAEYAVLARQRYASDATFDSADAELSSGWSQFESDGKIGWADVRGIVEEAWGRKSEVVADSTSNQAGFQNPPTFGDSGSAVPRNVDEPNQ